MRFTWGPVARSATFKCSFFLGYITIRPPGNPYSIYLRGTRGFPCFRIHVWGFCVLRNHGFKTW